VNTARSSINKKTLLPSRMTRSFKINQWAVPIPARFSSPSSAARIPRQQTRAPGDGWVTQRAPWRGVVGYRCGGLMGWRWGARSCAEAAAAGGICASLSVWKKTYRGIRAREIRDVDRPVCTSGPGPGERWKEGDRIATRAAYTQHATQPKLNFVFFGDGLSKLV
jgi:hypothetical protein